MSAGTLRWPAWRAVVWAVALLALAVAGCGKQDDSKQAAGKSGAATASIGRIHALEGDVRIIGARGEERAQAGVLIDRSETVRTMANAWALLAMSDGATITVRADSELRFDDYRYDPDGEPQQNTAAISLVKGALRSITGLIGQTNGPGYQIKTPTATIGIRGTDHEPAYYPPPPPGQKADHPPGTYDKVNSGETVIRRPAGEVAVRRGQTAYAPVEVKTRPQILERAPVFYQRYAEVDRRVVDRREEFNRQFAGEQQRRQQERERLRQLQDQKQKLDAQKRLETQKQQLDDRKKQQEERAKQQDALKKKQDEQKRDREKKQDELRKKQQDDQKKRQDDQKKKQEEQKKKQEESRKKQDEAKKARAESKAGGKAPEKADTQKKGETRQQQQQQRQEKQQAQQQQQQQRQQQQQERARQQQLQREQQQQQRQQQQLQQQQQRQQQQMQREQQQQLRQQLQQQQQQQRQQQQQQRGRDKDPRER